MVIMKETLNKCFGEHTEENDGTLYAKDNYVSLCVKMPEKSNDFRCIVEFCAIPAPDCTESTPVIKIAFDTEEQAADYIWFLKTEIYQDFLGYILCGRKTVCNS